MRAIENTRSTSAYGYPGLACSHPLQKIVASMLQGGMKGCLVHYGAMHFTGVYRQDGQDDVYTHHKPRCNACGPSSIDVLFT